MHIEDPDYLEGLIKGDKEIIIQIYEFFFPKVNGFIKSNKGTRDDSEDIFHNALFQITLRYKKEKFEINTSFEAYLFTVCKNLWRKELNFSKKRVRKNPEIELVSIESVTAKSILEQQRWELFDEKLEELSPNCRDLLKEYFKQKSYEEIIENFGYANENTAFQRVFKCKAKLIKLIKEDNRFKKLMQ